MTTLSLQQQLKNRSITLEAALQAIVSPTGTVALDLVDTPLSNHCFKQLRQTPLPVLPLLLWQNRYYLGSPKALDHTELQTLKQRLNTDIEIIRIDEISYRKWYRQHTIDHKTIATAKLINPLTGEADTEDITELTELSLAQTDNQIERVKTIIASALRHRASDIHLEPSAEGLKVRYRIDGILRTVTTLPSDISRKVIVSIKVMSEMDIADSRRPQDGRMAEQYMSPDQQEQGLDLRVSTLPCVSGVKGEAGEKIVMRLLRQQNSFQTIADLGFSDRALSIYHYWLSQPQGLIIYTGPTGSGKTSTLYTSIQAIAQDSKNITTVEDPVEYILPDITQTQVNETAGMTFAAGLRAILRQDPDIIMLGEIRDHETAETAVRAALTGHLVLTTLHTNDAAGAIPRLRDIGPEPGLISDALLGVVAQRLVRRVCPHCATPYTPTDADLKVLGLQPEDANPKAWRKGKGCAHCFHSGYLGREALIELLHVDETIRQIIYDGSMVQLNRYLQESEFQSFRLAAIDKVTQGITTIEEIKRVLPFSALHSKFSHPVATHPTGQRVANLTRVS
ncbi:GspE/PulE family protein [Alkalinema sp. FACHB-956]|uniref:GspE/PulE family protein n=1 Tax=Alkalinema sp. FACHB-956 TaxID=2692768 RepID=UPI00168A2F93|nr:GspE/PulE family protein [Alkalinema sp. FACHB-956]MBD2329172.1 type II/IV secretion system protein [Alkalinema sp. FACHB-956]